MNVRQKYRAEYLRLRPGNGKTFVVGKVIALRSVSLKNKLDWRVYRGRNSACLLRDPKVIF